MHPTTSFNQRRDRLICPQEPGSACPAGKKILGIPGRFSVPEKNEFKRHCNIIECHGYIGQAGGADPVCEGRELNWTELNGIGSDRWLSHWWHLGASHVCEGGEDLSGWVTSNIEITVSSELLCQVSRYSR